MMPSERRFQYLLHLAVKSQWKFGVAFDAIGMGNDLGFTPHETERTLFALSDSGYVQLSGGPLVSIADKGLDKAEELKMMNTQRMALQVLQKADVAAIPPLDFAELQDIQNVLSMSDTQKIDALRYLHEKGLIRVIDDGWSVIQVTAAGKDQLAKSLLPPSPLNPGFLATNNILVNYGTMSNNQVAQAGGNADLTGTFQIGVDRTDLSKLVSTLKEGISKITEFNSDSKDEAEHHVQTVENQLSREKPNAGIIRTSLLSLKTVLEQTVSSAAASVLLGSLKTWLNSHGISV